mmetsp:Transcript_7785/g.10744  ORF Transcript_7785/g.10744 Transcript_7785/m.10744 type:complete len:131 (+) Transcript_7785:138-530(+)
MIANCKGHKFFSPMEMKALTEAQIRERHAASNFENTKASSKLFRERNPLMGETNKSKICFGETDFPDSVSLKKEDALTNSLKRPDYIVERIDCLHNRQDCIIGELEFLKLKMKEQQIAIQSAKLSQKSQY